MADSPHTPPKPTLESLLRLKRHERPPAEFWMRFDRELRERALRELVRPAPAGWRWSRALLGRAAPWMTAGAAAAIALVMVMHRPEAVPAQAAVPVVAAAPSADVETFAAAPAAFSTAPALAADIPANAGPPTYVVAELAQEAAPASNYHKVSATVAFEPARDGGVRYAAAALGPQVVAVQAGAWRY